MTDHYRVTLADTEARREMSRYIAMALLKTVVLLDVMEVVTSNNDGSLHFVCLDNTYNGVYEMIMSKATHGEKREGRFWGGRKGEGREGGRGGGFTFLT